MFALVLSSMQIAVVVLAAIAVVAIFRLFFRVDDKIEARREAAIETGKVAAELGFEMCSQVCNKYAIGDYSGFIGTLKVLVQQLLNPETRMTLLCKPFYKLLAHMLKDNVEREKILAIVEEAVTAAKSQASKTLKTKVPK